MVKGITIYWEINMVSNNVLLAVNIIKPNCFPARVHIAVAQSIFERGWKVKNLLCLVREAEQPQSNTLKYTQQLGTIGREGEKCVVHALKIIWMKWLGPHSGGHLEQLSYSRDSDKGWVNVRSKPFLPMLPEAKGALESGTWYAT